MPELPVETLKLDSTGPAIGLELNSYYEVLGEAFWSFIEERLIRIAEALSKKSEPLTIWAYLDATGALVLHFVGGGPESDVKKAILDNTSDLGFEDKDIVVAAVNPGAEPLFGTRNGKTVAFVETLDPEAREEGLKGIAFEDGEFFWVGFQIEGEQDALDYALYHLVEDEAGEYHIEEERKIPIYLCRYAIED